MLMYRYDGLSEFHIDINHTVIYLTSLVHLQIKIYAYKTYYALIKSTT